MTENCPYTLTSSGAIISECKKYRYQLARIWDDKKPTVTFIMLNPSTADANKDDATIRRCIGFASSWGFGGIKVVNLFPYRSTDPKELLKARNPFGDSNHRHIFSCFNNSEKTVCAWGNSAIVNKLIKKYSLYMPLLNIPTEELHYIELANDGTPKHPLYLPKIAQLKKYEIPENSEKCQS